jgi:hypothetical protein
MTGLERRRINGEDHDVPYAPLPPAAFKLAAVIPVADPLTMYADDPASLWGAYWRRREFNQRRHANPFPRINLFRRSAHV